MKKDSEENLVNNKNDFPELRHAEPNPRKKKKLVFPRTKGSMKKLELNYCGVKQDYRRLGCGRVGHQRTKTSPRSRLGISKK